MTSSSWSHLNFTAFLNSASPWDAGCTLEGPEGCRGAPRTGKAEELVRCAAEAGGVQPCTALHLTAGPVHPPRPGGLELIPGAQGLWEADQQGRAGVCGCIQ
jgi:hypothetical protein